MVLGAITYLDRVTISVTRPDVARDLGLSPTQMGYVFSAFYLAYAQSAKPGDPRALPADGATPSTTTEGTRHRVSAKAPSGY